LVPNYEDNDDIAHTCGEGRIGQYEEGTNPRCISQDHLQQAKHYKNLEAIGCNPYFQCPNCKHVTKICQHDPSCTGSVELSKLAKEHETRHDGKKVAFITYTYADGTELKVPYMSSTEANNDDDDDDGSESSSI